MLMSKKKKKRGYNDEDWLTPREAAAVIKCTAHNVRHLIRSGQMKARKVPDRDKEDAWRYEIQYKEVRKFIDPSDFGRPRGGDSD